MRIPYLQYVNKGSFNPSLLSSNPDLFKLIKSLEIRRLQNPLGMKAILYRRLRGLKLSTGSGILSLSSPVGVAWATLSSSVRVVSSQQTKFIIGLCKGSIEGMNRRPLPRDWAISNCCVCEKFVIYKCVYVSVSVIHLGYSTYL